MEHCALPGTLESQPIPAAPVSVHRHHLPQLWFQRGTENQQKLSGFIIFYSASLNKDSWLDIPRLQSQNRWDPPALGYLDQTLGSCIPTSLLVHVQPARIPPATSASLHRSLPRDTRVIQARRAQQGFLPLNKPAIP